MAKLDTLLVDGQTTKSTDLPGAFANRAFLLADGTFESMRFTSGHVPFLSLHVQRLHAALDAHGMNIPNSLQLDALQTAIQRWHEKWKVRSDVWLRRTLASR